MSRIHIGAQRRTWESPMSNQVTHVAIALREAMEDLGWVFKRERTERLYSRFSVIVPLTKVAYVFRFRVTDPLDDVTFDLWEMRMTHKGDITFLAIDNYRFEDMDLVHQVLSELVERLPRRPWQFPLGQRLEAGLAIPEWGNSRRMWQTMGFDVGEKTPKDWIPRGSVGDRMREGLELDPSDDDLERRTGDGDLVGVGDHEDQGRADHEEDQE